ncbi:hypothetical protein ACSBL2_13645 [Pedobacter sp. AW31-3R]
MKQANHLMTDCIMFTYNSGKVVKTSFAVGAEGTPARPDSDLIFIGG